MGLEYKVVYLLIAKRDIYSSDCSFRTMAVNVINSVKPQLNGHEDIGRDDDLLENLYTCNAMEITNLKIGKKYVV